MQKKVTTRHLRHSVFMDSAEEREILADRKLMRSIRAGLRDVRLHRWKLVPMTGGKRR